MHPSPPQVLRALVLDGQYCHALAAVRSLGRGDAVVAVASHKPHAQSFASRWCAEEHHCPDPNRERAAYVRWLVETLRRGRYDATLFFEEATADILSAHHGTVRVHTGCPLPAREVFLTASHKDRAARLARQIGVPVPLTHELPTLEDAERLAGRIDYPAVVKGVSSSGGQQVAVAHDASRLVHEIRRITALRRDSTLPLPVVQEFVPGQGYGLTALMRRGQPLATFMHRRLAEHDVSKGVQLAHGASGAESVDEPALLEAGLSLLRALCWDGIAMVEFKRHARDGTFFFIEINPRFVGSLELAIAAGVDLPWLYARLAAGHPVAGPTCYRIGLKYRWLLSKNVAEAFERPLGYALGVLASVRPDTRSDICLRDPRPHLNQLRNAAWWIRQHFRRRRSAAADAPAPDAAPGGKQAEERRVDLTAPCR
ncbi:MAG: ATP-grasp domain-containing protein [Candidatus Krumholzibacteriia bacterium]